MAVRRVVALRCSVLLLTVLVRRRRRWSALRAAVVLLLLLRRSRRGRVTLRRSSVAARTVVVVLTGRRTGWVMTVLVVRRRRSTSVHRLLRTGITRRGVRLVELVKVRRASMDSLRGCSGRYGRNNELVSETGQELEGLRRPTETVKLTRHVATLRLLEAVGAIATAPLTARRRVESLRDLGNLVLRLTVGVHGSTCSRDVLLGKSADAVGHEHRIVVCGIQELGVSALVERRQTTEQHARP